MPKLSVLAGSVSQSLTVFVQDSSSTVGAGLAGLLFNTSNLACNYSFAGANATSTSVTLATLGSVTSPWSSGGFLQIDSVGMKGWYRFDLPNAALATGKGRSVGFNLYGAASMAQCPFEVELTGVDNQDSVRFGLQALPNNSAAASGGLIINGANTGAITLGALTTGNVVHGSVSTGNVSVGGTLTVTGATTLAGLTVGAFSCTTLTASGAVSFGSTFAIAGAAALQSTLTVTGAVVHSSTTTFTGPVVAANAANNITGVAVGSGTVTTVSGNVNGDLAGRVLGSTTTAFSGVGTQADVEQWRANAVPATNVSGVPVVDVKYNAGTQVFNFDGTLAGATSATVTLPALDSAGSAVPDSGQFAYHELEVYTGTGRTQRVLLTTAAGSARQYNVLAGTMPDGTDSTSTYVMWSGWRSNDVLIGGVTPGSATIGSLSNNLDKTGYTLTVTPPTAAAIATAILTDTAAGDVSVSGSVGKIIVGQLGGAFGAAGSSTFTVAALQNAPSGTGASAAAIATAVWQDLTASGDFTVSGSVGNLLKTDINATISSRSDGSSVTVGTGGIDSPAFTANAVTRVQSGLALAATALSTATWTNGRAANLDGIDATVSSRLASASYIQAPSASSIVTAIFTDMTGGSDFNTVGSVGKLIKDNLDAAVSSRSTYAGGSVTVGTAGLDLVAVESGVNARQALSAVAAACMGLISGAGTGTITVKGVNVSTTRATVNSDSVGNRSTVTLNLPS